MFHDCFKLPVSKTLCFCGRFGLIWSRGGPVDCRLGCRFFSKSMQKMGFWKHGQEKPCENTGFCAREPSKPHFYRTFLSVSKTPIEFSRFICFLGAVLGPPLSRPQNRRFHTKTLIAGSHFQNTRFTLRFSIQKHTNHRKIRDSRCVSLL